MRRPVDGASAFWSGDTLALSDDVTLINVGGHFPGSTALHWKNGPRGRPALFPGDSPHVTQDRKHVTFMHSVPNFTPMKPSAVRRMRALLAPYDYDDVYGFSWGRNIIGNGRAAVEASFDRYFQRGGRMNAFLQDALRGALPGASSWRPPTSRGCPRNTPGKWSKPLRFLGDRGFVELLRMSPGTVMPLHRHTGEVHVYQLTGQRQLCTGEILGPGDYVHEPAGTSTGGKWSATKTCSRSWS